MRGSPSLCWTALVLSALMGAGPGWSAPSRPLPAVPLPGAQAAVVEGRIHAIEAQVAAVPARTFVKRLPNGRLLEMHTYAAGGDTYVRYNAQDLKVLQWVRRPGGVLHYESWYSGQHVHERLDEDDRTVTFVSYYTSGRKWQEYRADRKTRSRSVHVYSPGGKAMTP